VEVRAELGRNRRGCRGDSGGPTGHGGGGGVAAPDLAEKEAKQIWRRRMVLGGERWQRRMVLGGGAADMVRMVWGRRCGVHCEYQRVYADKTLNLSGTARQGEYQ
jgi:hypothetical protein